MAKKVRQIRTGRPPKDVSDGISDRILNTALTLFTTQGFTATSIEQVALACGSGKHTIYRRFESKSDLFSAVMEFQKQKFFDLLVSIECKRENPLETLKESCRRLLELIVSAEIVDFYRMTISEAEHIPKIASNLQCEESPSFLRILDLVIFAQKSKDLNSIDPKFLTAQLLQIMTGYPLNEVLLGSKEFSSHSKRSKYFEKAWILFINGAGRSKKKKIRKRPI
ncbi:TetR/AcrR family transcriptional regulator [Leptospira andrefontaineae]|uniref:TetR/AcrR family transcriptional regulator n=1 Tax=Leptospira andrefontaineae TaxID=2484976 RepID=A0A4R9H8T4_9LEPT|nr:TetR/AcrR family transcriptional regulator [Leptospira andrefontaineae]TGK42461.1 TetR/AcrR family transcriptional regulator [Leptospira andrefontaineae]